ncbi:hypothetical protein VNO77_04158 [Canavalia gladiata]|uniref:Uncharacterized protein n=1 Tax=Canavalia gladiata TaxID=3824 RepID=A0AAN9RCX3_CANGL
MGALSRRPMRYIEMSSSARMAPVSYIGHTPPTCENRSDFHAEAQRSVGTPIVIVRAQSLMKVADRTLILVTDADRHEVAIGPISEAFEEATDEPGG